MTWWALLYLVVYTLLSVGGLWDDYRVPRPPWFLGFACVSNLTIVFLFVAFWHPALRDSVGFAAPVAFVAAMCWELFQAVEDIRGLSPDPELLDAEPRRVALITAGVLVILCVPAFVVAGVSAFRA